jgi:Tripartite tricarboxylate transporter family receptor
MRRARLFGMGAPKNTPKEIIAKLNTEINAILAEPDMKKRLVELGGEPLIQTPENFGADVYISLLKPRNRNRRRQYREGAVAVRNIFGAALFRRWNDAHVSLRLYHRGIVCLQGDATIYREEQDHAQCNAGLTGLVSWRDGRDRRLRPCRRRI